jgi:hypothetical protein
LPIWASTAYFHLGLRAFTSFCSRGVLFDPGAKSLVRSCLFLLDFPIEAPRVLPLFSDFLCARESLGHRFPFFSSCPVFAAWVRSSRSFLVPLFSRCALAASEPGLLLLFGTSLAQLGLRFCRSAVADFRFCAARI